jgi:hypothetical protein
MKSIIEIKIKKEVDTSPDVSFIGEYIDQEELWAISRKHGKYVANLTKEERREVQSQGREYRFFRPYAAGEKVGSKDYKKYGKRDYERMESLNNGDWCFMGVWAEAYIQTHKGGIIQTVRSCGLWGIESDGGDDYMRSIMGEEVTSIKDELLRLGFSAEEIDKAIKEIDYDGE